MPSMNEVTDIDSFAEREVGGRNILQGIAVTMKRSRSIEWEQVQGVPLSSHLAVPLCSGTTMPYYKCGQSDGPSILGLVSGISRFLLTYDQWFVDRCDRVPQQKCHCGLMNWFQDGFYSATAPIILLLYIAAGIHCFAVDPYFVRQRRARDSSLLRHFGLGFLELCV